MPLEELMHKWKTGARMSNGQKVKSQAQAVAIAASEGYLGKKKKKRRKEHPKLAALRSSKS